LYHGRNNFQRIQRNGRKVRLKNGAQALRGTDMGTTVFKIIKGASKGKKPRRKRR